MPGSVGCSGVVTHVAVTPSHHAPAVVPSGGQVDQAATELLFRWDDEGRPVRRPTGVGIIPYGLYEILVLRHAPPVN